MCDSLEFDENIRTKRMGMNDDRDGRGFDSSEMRPNCLTSRWPRGSLRGIHIVQYGIFSRTLGL